MPGKHFLKNLYERRTLLFQLVRRDYQQRFVGSAAGWVWGVIHPLVLLASYTFVFQVCLKATVPAGEPTQNYSIFLLCGFLPWMLFQETVTRSAGSLVDNANLITKTVFPSEVVPVSIFLSSLINHLIGMALVVGAIVIWERRLTPMILLLPVYMLLLGMLAIGIGWVMASLQVYIRDTAQVLLVAMTLWFWVTPIMISESQIPERLRFLVALNPMSYFVRAYRTRLLSSQPPGLRETAVLAGYSIAAFVLGGLFFRQLKRGFADVL